MIRGKILKQVPVAIDGVAVVVNPTLEIAGLTIQQLASIYTGKITNWSQLGGEDLEIVPYTRPLQSGTTEFFRHNILKDKTFGQRVVFLDYPTLALKQIETEPGGIFFVSVSEVIDNCNLKILAIARGKEISWNHNNSEQKIILIVKITQTNEAPSFPSEAEVDLFASEAINCCLQLYPDGDNQSLPTGLTVKVLDATEKVCLSAIAQDRDDWMQLEFTCQSAEEFIIELNLGENFQETLRFC